MTNITTQKLGLVGILLLGLVCIIFLGCCHNQSTLTDLYGKTENPISSSAGVLSYKAVIVKLIGPVDASWITTIKQAFEVSNCGLVILWLESPGGGVADTKILAHQIDVLKVKYKKTLWVFSERWMMSGAYWLACSADSIFVSPAGMCGSIGVYMERIDASKMDGAAGVKHIIIRSGDLKAAGNPHMPAAPQEILFFASQVQQLYIEFIEYIYKQRTAQLYQAYFITHGEFSKTGNDVVKFLIQIADGRSYFAREALDLGLIDGIFYFDELVYWLKDKGYKVYTVSGIEINDLWPQ